MSAQSVQGGRAWVLGDDLNTDVLAPGHAMKFGLDAIARHCLEAIEPTFAADVRPGDVLVGGRNFGVGSSREQAVQVLKHLQVAAVVAQSFAGLYYRNGFNLGLPLLVCPDAGTIRSGDRLAIDIKEARVRNLTQNRALACEPVPPHLVEMIRDGGLLPHLEKRIRSGALRQAASRKDL